jgi:lysophospholipid acyltransferase (LPLAT)-like uncharacterized protein
VRLWVFTYRVRLAAPPGFEGGAAVLSFWHGQQMALLAARRLAGEAAAVLVSRSKDGDVQSGVMTALGFRVVRGSSSRGGARALTALIELLRRGYGVALSVDGPRGPRHVAKGGAAVAAFAAGTRLFPVASAARRTCVLTKAWDRFEIPLPFSEVAVVIGAPLVAADARANPELLGRAIEACRRRAERLAGVRVGAADSASEARP